jgi:hypothetical protein
MYSVLYGTRKVLLPLSVFSHASAILPETLHYKLGSPRIPSSPIAKLREPADYEIREINEAYDFFKKKYGLS